MLMEYLVHHGIKGQKWGVRRYQNPDGSYTAEGKIRYGVNGRRVGDVSKVALSVKKSSISDHSDDSSDFNKMKRISAAGAYFVTDLVTLNPMMLYDGAILAGAAYKKIESRHKQKEMIKRSEESDVDSKTGLRLKKNDTTQKYDLKHVNPTYGDFKANSKNNCALCSIAYDLRRRGYEVTAATASSGYNINEIASVYKNSKPQRYTSDSKNPFGMGKEIRQKIQSDLSSQGNSRGIFAIYYRGFGHAVAYEVSNGKVQIMDAQNGKRSSLNKYFNSDVVSCDVLRTDNLEIDPEYARRAVR